MADDMTVPPVASVGEVAPASAQDGDSGDNDLQGSTGKSKKKSSLTVPSNSRLTIQSAVVRHGCTEEDVVYYDILVRTPDKSWTVTKRFRQFEELHSVLLQNYSHKLPTLPAKHYKLFVDHTDEGFIEQRRALLDNYVNKLLKVKDISGQQCVVNFFHDDTNSISDQKDAEFEEDEWTFPEDQEVTGVAIPSVRKMSDHVLYQIEVTNDRKRRTFRTWTVLKRFTQFFDMDQQLKNDFKDQGGLLSSLPPPPPRRVKLIYDHMDDDFIEERRVLLENYLSKLLRFPEVAKNEAFLAFLGVDM